MPLSEDKNGRVECLAEQLVEKEAIINGISDTLMLLDAGTYEILEVNQSFLDAYGLSRDQVIGNTCYKITHHLSRPCHHIDSNCPFLLEDSVGTGNSSHVEMFTRIATGKLSILKSLPIFFSPTFPIKVLANGAEKLWLGQVRSMNDQKEKEMSTEAKISIEILKTLTKAISRARDLDFMTNHLAELLVAALDIRGCVIYFLDPETKELEMLASFGLSASYLTKGLVLAEKSIGSDLAGEPVIIADVGKDARLQYPEQAKKEGIAAILSIPIVFLNEVIGVLRLYHHEVWNISKKDLDSLHLLAHNIGLAMTCTRLLNAVHSIFEVTSEVLPSKAGLQGASKSEIRNDEIRV